jgi:phosphatidate cytidylyltransferase
MSELGRRVVVAVIAAPIALLALWLGGATLATLAACLAAIGAWEFFRIARAADREPLMGVGVVLSALTPLVVHAHLLGIIRVPWSLPVLVLLAVVTIALFTREPDHQPMSSAAITLVGAAYTGGLLSYALALRSFDYAVGETARTVVVVFPILLTWASDVGAYFTGRAFGGRKLMPSVSPGKTVSGAVGGLALAVIVAWAYQRWALRPIAQLAFAPWTLPLVAIAIAAAGQVGDLVESLFKREGHVKDSSNLLPGHGGVLDRLDSQYFALPIGWMLMYQLVLPAPR